jgi:hypothetical protein
MSIYHVNKCFIACKCFTIDCYTSTLRVTQNFIVALQPYTYTNGNAEGRRVAYFDTKYCKCKALNRIGRFVLREVALITLLP